MTNEEKKIIVKARLECYWANLAAAERSRHLSDALLEMGKIFEKAQEASAKDKALSALMFQLPGDLTTLFLECNNILVDNEYCQCRHDDKPSMRFAIAHADIILDNLRRDNEYFDMVFDNALTATEETTLDTETEKSFEKEVIG